MPPPRSKSPLTRPPSNSTSNYPSKFISSSEAISKEENSGSQDNPYDDRRSQTRETSNKTDNRSSPQKTSSTSSDAPNPHSSTSEATSSSNAIPGTSTSLLRPTSELLHHRIRRASDPGRPMDTEDAGSIASDDHPGSAVEIGAASRQKFNDFRVRDSQDLTIRVPSRSPSERSGGKFKHTGNYRVLSTLN